ncbi:MAG TPA: hypothetical protein VGD52_14465 [Pseudoduganella sp.]
MRTSTKILLSRIVFAGVCLVLVGFLTYVLWMFKPVQTSITVLELFVLGMSLIVLIIGDRLIALRIIRTLRRRLQLPHRHDGNHFDRLSPPDEPGRQSTSVARQTLTMSVFVLVFWLLVYGVTVLCADTSFGAHFARMWILPAAIGTMTVSNNLLVPVYLRIPLMALVLGLLLGQLYLGQVIPAGEINGKVDRGLILASALTYAGLAGIAYVVVSRTMGAAFTLTVRRS